MNKKERIQKEINLKVRINELKGEKKTVREITDILNISSKKYYEIIRSNPANQIFSNSEEDRKRKEEIEKFKEDYKELNKEKRQEFLIPGTLESKETPGGRNREIIRRMAGERTPDKQDIKNFIREEISNVISEESLKDKLKLFYPDVQYSRDLLEKNYKEETLKIKEVEGLGIFLYYSRKGKMQFHEYLLAILTKRLRQKKIKFKKPNSKKGSDLEIGKFKIELEVRSNPRKQPERRNNLKERCIRDPENTIIILLNKKDKQTYLKSELREIIYKNDRFLTLLEFINKIDKLTEK